MTSPQSNSELTSKVITIISEAMLIAPEDIQESSSFEDLGIDSLGGLTIVGELEDAFDVSIPNEKALQISTINEAVNCLLDVLDSPEDGENK